MEKLVSVIMPSYNTAKFIAESIASVQGQTYKNWELIIVDDCSTDNTDEVVAPYLKDSRIIYFKNEENCGAAISRNRALREAKGKWIAFLDSDDVWEEDKLSRQISFMEEGGYRFSYTAYTQIGEDGSPLNKRITGPKKISHRHMKHYGWPGCLTVMYDADFVGLIQIANLKKRNDDAMWLKVSRKCKCYFLNEALAHYRVRGGSLSRQSKLKLIKYHYRLFRIGERMNPVRALYWTCVQMFFGVWKRLLYVKRIKGEPNEK